MLFKFKAADLPEMLTLWAARYSVFVPGGTPENVQLRPWIMHGRTSERFMEPNEYINLSMSPKSFVFNERESLFRWEGNEKTTTATSDPLPIVHGGNCLLFGIRPCDVAGLAYMDRFFLGEYHDINYQLRRQDLFIVAVNCLRAGPNCFCSSQGTGPFIGGQSTENDPDTARFSGSGEGFDARMGYDLLLTPDYAVFSDSKTKTDDDWYWIEPGTDRGRALLTQVAPLLHRDIESVGVERKKALYEASLASFTRHLEQETLSRVLAAHFADPIWDTIAEGCISCTGCTRVCPTCTCFTTEEETTSEHAGTRFRVWDSCQSVSFTRNAEWSNPRSKTSAVRYRMYDKLRYIEERFGIRGCTGCGRCTAACPAGIDMVSIVNELAARTPDAANLPDPAPKVPYTRKKRFFDPQLYTPFIAEITHIYQEAKDILRYTVRYRDRPEQGSPALRGQFFMLTVFGYGEVAISVPFSDRVRDGFTFYVKKVGKVTTAMHNLKVGDVLGLRGPFGVPLPYEDIKGRDLLVVGSGVGHAPVRAALVRAIENRQDFGRIAIMASATSYSGLLLKDDLRQWSALPGVEVYYALSKPTDEVKAHVGYVNDLFADLGLDWPNTTAIACASPRRIKAVARDLLKLGMRPSDIYTALETNMHCGVGKCGHCKVGSHYMCIDGPVFTYEEMLLLPPEF